MHVWCANVYKKYNSSKLIILIYTHIIMIRLWRIIKLKPPHSNKFLECAINFTEYINKINHCVRGITPIASARRRERDSPNRAVKINEGIRCTLRYNFTGTNP